MKLSKSANSFSKPRYVKSWEKLELLLSDLESRELSPSLVTEIEDLVNQLNASFESEKAQISAARKGFQALLKSLEKELNLVAKNHYRLRWLALGMSLFGIPIGVALSTSLSNMSFIGIGLPIGLAVGISIGTSLDKQAQKENRQLNIEL